MIHNVLITRPRGESESLAAILEPLGIDSFIEPMLTVMPRRDVRLPIETAQALLVTSANGVRALAGLTAERKVPVLAVGAATAEAARAAGFKQVTAATGTVAELAVLARETFDPLAGPLLHIAGSAVAGDLTGDLRQAGFAIRQLIVYDAVPSQNLSAAVRTHLADGDFDAVLLYSPRTAQTFVTLLRQAGLAEKVGGMEAICLSEAVAARAATLAWRRVRVAERPDQAALIALLQKA